MFVPIRAGHWARLDTMLDSLDVCCCHYSYMPVNLSPSCFIGTTEFWILMMWSGVLKAQFDKQGLLICIIAGGGNLPYEQIDHELLPMMDH